MMKNHLCILFCYQNIDHIKQCHRSLSLEDIDFFVVENSSNASCDIRDYFLTQSNVIGHICFNTNITYRALETFFSSYDYYALCEKYNFITVTDCDILLNDSEEAWLEIKANLNCSDVGVSCIDLSLENFPHHVPGSSGWIPNPIKITDQYIECYTGVHLLTIKNQHLSLLKTKPFIDTHLGRAARSLGLKWVKTKISKAVHLTWDLYVDGNSYHNHKRENLSYIWDHTMDSDYTILK